MERDNTRIMTPIPFYTDRANLNACKPCCKNEVKPFLLPVPRNFIPFYLPTELVGVTQSITFFDLEDNEIVTKELLLDEFESCEGQNIVHNTLLEENAQYELNTNNWAGNNGATIDDVSNTATMTAGQSIETDPNGLPINKKVRIVVSITGNTGNGQSDSPFAIKLVYPSSETVLETNTVYGQYTFNVNVEGISPDLVIDFPDDSQTDEITVTFFKLWNTADNFLDNCFEGYARLDFGGDYMYSEPFKAYDDVSCFIKLDYSYCDGCGNDIEGYTYFHNEKSALSIPGYIPTPFVVETEKGYTLEKARLTKKTLLFVASLIPEYLIDFVYFVYGRGATLSQFGKSYKVTEDETSIEWSENKGCKAILKTTFTAESEYYSKCC